MKNTKNTKLVGFEPMSKAETEKVLGGKMLPPPPPPRPPKQK